MRDQSGGIHEGERVGRLGSSKEGVLEEGELVDLLPWPSPWGEFLVRMRNERYKSMKFEK